jgi:HEAT repeat protein
MNPRKVLPEEVISSFLKAYKNYGLYPETHEILRITIENFKRYLDAFLENQSHFKIVVEKDRILHEGKVLYEDTSKGENVTSILFRDGVIWLEFREGILLEEITGFFKILNKYKMNVDEAEGDVVTALWEEGYPHLRYGARDIFLENDPAMGMTFPDLFRKNEPELSDQDEGEIQGDHGDQGKAGRENFLTPQTASLDLWELTPDEKEAIREMVVAHENYDTIDAVLDVLVIILQKQSETKDHHTDDIAAILEFLAKGFRDILDHEEFSLAFKLLKRLDEVRNTLKSEKPEEVFLLDRFFLEVSSIHILEPLNRLWPKMGGLDHNRIKPFREVLLLLHPQAILAFGPMLPEITAPNVRRLMLEVIGSLAIRDMTPLETLISRSEEAQVREFIRLLAQLKTGAATELLLKMTRHASYAIRREVIPILVDRDPQILKDLFPLIEDENDSIRWFMFKQLGQKRDPLAEALLLAYLERREFQRSDPQHILTCYRTLGYCGSSRSIPFLGRVLLEQRLTSVAGLDNLLDRQGAATALMGLRSQEADEILKKASRSLVPGIRMAYKKASEG